MKVVDAIVKVLISHRVQRIFGYSGYGNQELLDAIYRASVEFVLVRHEHTAAVIADTYARLTGSPGVFAVTSGPGATNIVNGIAQAYCAQSPVIALVAEHSTEGGANRFDQAALFAPITRFCQSIERPENTEEIITQAFEVAVKNPPGPAYVGLPSNVAKMEIGAGPVKAASTGQVQTACVGRMKPSSAMEIIKAKLAPDTLVVTDVGDHMVYAWDAFGKDNVLFSEDFYSMGFGFPAALSAKLTYPERPVCCITGDGGFAMVAAELETAVRQRLPIATIVFNNCCLSMIKRRQRETFDGRYIAVHFGEVDFARIARGFGALGERIATLEELEAALDKTIGSSDVPCVLDVLVDWDDER